MILRITAVVLLAAAITACERGEENVPASYQPPPMDTGTVLIVTASDTIRMPVELAKTDAERSYGLMERTSLPADRGMLFVYNEPQDSTSGFYMFRTRIPLDIAFTDANGRILSIMHMEPCVSPEPRLCYVYSPGMPYYNALEANSGFFARNGIREGDQVVSLK